MRLAICLAAALRCWSSSSGEPAPVPPTRAMEAAAATPAAIQGAEEGPAREAGLDVAGSSRLLLARASQTQALAAREQRSHTALLGRKR
eukprot:14828928-Alexandrium_andersonii.AAC.1